MQKVTWLYAQYGSKLQSYLPRQLILVVKFSTKSTCITILATFLATSFTLFRLIVYPSAWTLLTNVCYIKKVLSNFEISSTFCHWHLVDNLYLEQFHGPPLPLKNSTIWLRWSMFLNLWTVFPMEAIVLVAVLTSSAKKYDLGPLQDSYPARRPSKFRYRNSVTKM